MVTVKQIVADIIEGDFDICLGDIENAIKARRQALRIINRPEPTPKQDRPFRVGDVVKLNSHCSTTYLRGRHVLITDKLQKNYKIRFLDGPQGRFGESCRVPPALLSWIE